MLGTLKAFKAYIHIVFMLIVEHDKYKPSKYKTTRSRVLMMHSFLKETLHFFTTHQIQLNQWPKRIKFLRVNRALCVSAQTGASER